ncbi:hypothetical protein GE21DRAFT_1185943, partial [Neurospora crassa]
KNNWKIYTRIFNKVSYNKKEAILKVKTVNKLIQLNFNNRLSYIFTYFIINIYLILLSNRVNIVYWVLRESLLF